MTTPRPRRSRHDAGSSTSRAGRRAPAPRRAATTNSRWVRPPARLSEPWARNRPRSQADPAVLGRGVPVEGRRWPAPSVGRAGDAAIAPESAASEAVALGDPADARAEPGGLGPRGRRPAPGRCAASSARRAATRSRSEPRSRSGASARRATGRCASAGLALDEPDDRGREPGRVVVMGVRRGRRRRRGRGAARLGHDGGQRRRTGSAGQSLGAARPEVGCWRGRRRRCRRRCGRRAPRRGRRGRSRSSRRAGSRRCRRRRGAPATPRPRRGSPAAGGSAAGS